MFALRPTFHADRQKLTSELKTRLVSLRDSPLVLSIQVLVSDGESTHDVLMLAQFVTHAGLVQPRETPEHRKIIEFYAIYFDDNFRSSVDCTAPGSPEVRGYLLLGRRYFLQGQPTGSTAYQLPQWVNRQFLWHRVQRH